MRVSHTNSWYGVCDIGDDGCGKTGTGLENIADWAKYSLLGDEFGVWLVLLALDSLKIAYALSTIPECAQASAHQGCSTSIGPRSRAPAPTPRRGCPARRATTEFEGERLGREDPDRRRGEVVHRDAPCKHIAERAECWAPARGYWRAWTTGVGCCRRQEWWRGPDCRRHAARRALRWLASGDAVKAVAVYPTKGLAWRWFPPNYWNCWAEHQLLRNIHRTKLFPLYWNISSLTFSCNFDHSSYSKNYRERVKW
jgi:hypothetical protein